MKRGLGEWLWKDTIASTDKAAKKIQTKTANMFQSISKNIEKREKKEKSIRKKKNKRIKDSAVSTMGTTLDIIGVILQVLDKLGVLQPILELVGGVFSMIGGSVMKILAPAIKELADVLFSPEMMELWKLLGELIGKMLTPILKVFGVVLKAITPALKVLIKLFGPIMIPIITILAKAIGLLVTGAMLGLILAIYAIGWVISGIIAFFSPLDNVNEQQQWEAMMLPIIGTMVSSFGEIVALAGGGYVSPTQGGSIIKAGEGGEGEFIIPESKMGGVGGGEDMLYATQDNGEKLDKIINLLGSQGRLR